MNRLLIYVGLDYHDETIQVCEAGESQPSAQANSQAGIGMIPIG